MVLRRLRRSAWLAFVVALPVALADGEPRHVYVGGLTDGELTLALGGGGADLPPFIVAGDELLAPPSGGTPRSDEATLPAGAIASGDIAPTMRPDRLTGTTTSTDYYEAFTPAIAPYKRLLAFDAVALDADGTPILTVADATPQPLALDRTTLGGARDAFWGSVVVDFRTGRRVVLPSVAPDARILHLRTEPPVAVHVERDSAGNFFLRSEAEGAGVVRVTYLTDVGRGFFARPIPSQRIDATRDRVPEVPDSVRSRGLTFAREIGIEPGSPAPMALAALVTHFRAFTESDDMPPSTGDTFLDLARSGVGVCRHRAYAFVVTALSLGLPARYVQNEAHAWVEVLLRDGYLRIDLGGGTQRVDTHGITDRPRHAVEAADPFPRPPEFLAGLGDAAMNGTGTEGVPSDEPVPGAPEGTQGPAETAPASPAERSTTDPGSPEANTSETSASGMRGVGTALLLERTSLRAYRGQAVDLRGSLVDETGAPVVGGRVEIRVGEALLGVALSGDDGAFGVSLAIPPDLGVGEHPLRVEFAGSGRYLPSAAR